MINIEILNDATNVAFFPFIPIWLLGLLFVGGCVIAAVCLMPTSGHKLTILGMERAGKSTLYNMLRTGEPGETWQTSIEEVAEFKIKDRDIRIKKGKDIGGGEPFMTYYEDLIKENEIIVFIFHVSRFLNEYSYQRDTKDRLDFVYRKAIEYNKEMKNLVMIASHIDILPKEKQESALKEIQNAINGKQYQEMFKNNFLVINLTNKEHINKLIEGIF